ncbi:SchA/CurD-like domain-containing protein [Streptomyces sp. NPDC001380]|uniref:SchA/CurD-like domain-containing protein n=1 Tax=Streptomyces sp. NPDC001380 TaxID=3364566 RepID=UPI0036A5D39D
MTALSESSAPPAPADRDSARLRVVLFCDINEGQQQRFLDAYEHMRHEVAAVPGHISDQLCQSIDEPTKWLITSEWENAASFLDWVDSPDHIEMVKPLHGCVRDTRSLRFTVAHQTGSPCTAESGCRLGGRAAAALSDRGGQAGGAAGAGTGLQERPAGAGRPQGGPQHGGPQHGGAARHGGVVRHALTFTVKPGTEQAVAGILAGYRSPQARVDEDTRLLRTSLFMHGNRVVRAVEVEGDLAAALRHVSQQPEVRAVEEAINPHLEQPRDFADPASVRSFFARAALPAAHHAEAPDADRAEVRRRALLYPVRRGCAQVAAKLLAGHDEQAVRNPDGPLVRSTVFQRDDLVVRVVDVRANAPEDPAAVAGVGRGPAAAELTHLLEPGEDLLLSTAEGLRRFLAAYDLALVTDRASQGS